MSVFEKAWRVLKMTPEEMEAAGFHAAAHKFVNKAKTLLQK
mgnify:CR=1 FL=1